MLTDPRLDSDRGGGSPAARVGAARRSSLRRSSSRRPARCAPLWLAVLAVVAPALAGGCSSGRGTEGDGGTGGGVGTGGDGGTGGSGGAGCPDAAAGPLGVAARADEGAAHEVVCSPLCYGTVPPSSGTHYPSWAAFKVYGAPVPWGFLVHSLEHGAVVVVYNCPQGCTDEIAAAQAWIAGVVDPLGCVPPRAILAPDPTLDVAWAASAWGWTLRADHFDRDQFDAFYLEHVADTLENFCSDGVDLFLSPSGWCP